MFQKATKHKSRLRMGLDGPSKAGKSYTGMRFAMVLAELSKNEIPLVVGPGNGRVAVISTEPGAAEKYIGESPDGIVFDFDLCELTDHSPESYVKAITTAGNLGYPVILTDSLSHEWVGRGGALEIVDKANGKNKFTDKDGWRKVTPLHNQLIDAFNRTPAHFIATMRCKNEYVIEQETKPSGQIIHVPRRIGVKPVQREGMEYEFDIIGHMDRTHTMTVDETRIPGTDGLVIDKPGRDFITAVWQWLNEGLAPESGTYTADVNQLAGSRELAEQAAIEREVAAHEAERKQRLAAALGQVPAVAVTEAEKIAANYTLGSTPTEQPPFDGGSVPGAAAAAPASAVEVAVPQTPAIATIEQCIELAGLGEIIGRSIEEIAAMCVERYGVAPNEIPYAEMANVLSAFREAAAEVQQAAGNPTTAA